MFDGTVRIVSRRFESETMLDDQSINPYAPTVTENTVGVKIAAIPDGNIFAKTPWVLMITVMGISASGALFGGAVMCIALVTDGGVDSVPAIAVGVTFGAFYAAFVAIPVLFVGFVVSIPARSGNAAWLASQTRLLAVSCGFLAGFLSIAAPFGFEPASLLFGIVPGVVGLFGTWFTVERFAIRRSISAPPVDGRSVGTLPKHPAGT
jgi:hypothetical protein